MNIPKFTTNPERIARLQENYNDGVTREKIPPEIREKIDLELLTVSPEKLRFLFQNALESYPPEVKNAKVKEYLEQNATPTMKKGWSFLPFGRNQRCTSIK